MSEHRNIREKNLEKKKWKPGQSGNPSGRPVDPFKKVRDELHKLTGPAFVKKTVELAKKGNPAALMIVWKRIMPELPQMHELKGEILHEHIHLHPELERKLHEIYRLSCVDPGAIGIKEGAGQEYPETGRETADGVDD